MSAERQRQIARLFTVGFHGTDPSPELLELLQRGVGGVVLFSRNVESPLQVFELIRAIKSVAPQPVFVAVDQEGGRVRRLRRGFTDLAAMRTLGETGDRKLAEEVGGVLGRELRAVGIDLDFAPVVDVDTNPNNPVIGDRSLASDADRVAEFAAALVTGLQAAGVAACAKHFPGHGDTAVDSHLGLPVVPHGLERLERVEFVPFRRVVRAGVASVMTAHVVLEAVDPGVPATLSKKVLTGLLRQHVGFERVVFSDDMEMQAIAGMFELGQAAVRAVDAGADSVLVCHSAERAHSMIDACSAAATGDAAFAAKVAAANLRIDSMLSRYARAPGDVSALDVLACDAHRAVAERLRKDSEWSADRPDPTEALGGRATADRSSEGGS